MSSRSGDIILSDLNKDFYIFNISKMTVVVELISGNVIPTVIYKQDESNYENRLYSTEDFSKKTKVPLLFENRQSLINIHTNEALFNYYYGEWYEEIKYQSSIDNIVNNF
jgi:hypothetical protein